MTSSPALAVRVAEGGALAMRIAEAGTLAMWIAETGALAVWIAESGALQALLHEDRAQARGRIALIDAVFDGHPHRCRTGGTSMVNSLMIADGTEDLSLAHECVKKPLLLSNH